MATGDNYTGGDLPDGFGFNPGQLIPQAPTVFPGESDLIYLFELAGEYLGGWAAVVSDVIVVILDLIDELVSLFTGKPREESTLTVASRFAHGINPAAHVAAVLINRNLQQNNIVLSSSDAADQKILGAIRVQAEQMLEAQGVTKARAVQVIDNVWGQTTSATQPLPLELNRPLPQGLTLVGPQALWTLYQQAYNHAIQQGDKPRQAAKIATQEMFNKGTLKDISLLRVEKQPQPQQPQCPPGETWDPVSMGCVPIVAPPPPPTPCVPTPQQYGDELTAGLDCVSENLNFIQAQLAELIGGATGTGAAMDPVTCAQLTALVSSLNDTLIVIGNAINAAASAPGTPVDLSAIVTALGELATAAASYPPAWEAIAAALAGKLDAIATSIASAPATDVSAIVAQLQKLFTTIDIPPAVVDALISAGYLSPDASSTIGQGDFGSSLITVIVNFAYKAVTNFLKAWGISFGPGGISIANPTDTISRDVGGLFADVVTVGDVGILPVVQALVAQIRAMLVPPGATQLGVINVNQDRPVAAAISVALTAAAASWLLSFAGVDAGESLTRIAEVIAGAIGFEELRDVVLGPLVRQGIATVAERQARAQFQQELPGTQTLQGLVAQGLLDPNRAKALSLLNGTSDELFPISQLAAYRGLNARQLLRLIETDLFTPQEIADEMRFAGLRGASQERMLRAAPYLATASERASLRSELQSAYVAGLLSDEDLQTRVLAIEQNTDLAGLVLERSQLAKLIAETKDLEAEYTALFVSGLLDDVSYREDLAALGLQPDMVTAIAAKAEARANVTTYRKNLAQAARDARALQKAIDQTALKNFAAGNIDAVALTAALIAGGLPATQVASLVDLAVLRKAGSLRWVYGLQLLPAAAALLRQRVSDLTDQRKRLQIDDAAYVQQLQALGIPAKYVNALQAGADALISPKTAAFAIPVGTT